MEAMEVITRARLTCPQCGYVQEADMPTDACQFFYDCVNCKSVLRPGRAIAASSARMLIHFAQVNRRRSSKNDEAPSY